MLTRTAANRIRRKSGGLFVEAIISGIAPLAILFAMALGASAVTPSLRGPSEYLPKELDAGIFYVPVARGADLELIRQAKSKKVKLNRPFYDKYHVPLISAVESFSEQKGLSLGDKVNLLGWLIIQTHNANKIGYLWGGDLEDGPKASGSTSGIGYDCSGYFWTAWESMAPQSVFANKGIRLDSRSYLKYGRQVFPRAKVDQAFVENLKALARPGDAIIDPNGHIVLYGYDPRGVDRAPIVMENGEYWNPLDKWLLRNKGKRMEVRSTYAEDGSLLVNPDAPKPGRTLPSLSSPEQLLLASAKPTSVLASRSGTSAVVASAKPKAPRKLPARPKAPARAEPRPSAPRARSEAGAVPEVYTKPSDGGLLGRLAGDPMSGYLKEISQYEAYDLASARPSRRFQKPNGNPRIVSVKAPAIRMWNDSIRLGVFTEDPDGDSIVQYRIRTKGTQRWITSDRPHFKTSMPGFNGAAILEFQVVDARGGVSPTEQRQIELVARPEVR